MSTKYGKQEEHDHGATKDSERNWKTANANTHGVVPIDVECLSWPAKVVSKYL